MLPTTHSRRSRGGARSLGFTLVEMLVSVALVIVLMLAVTQVFSIASKTVGGGQALGAAVRDAQAAQSVLARDFGAAATNGPCFIIRSQTTLAFRNRGDLFGDLDQKPETYDVDGDGDEAFPPADPTSLDVDLIATYKKLLYNFRNHRTDSVMFFARDRFVRQTGNDGTLVANMTSNEAAVYIHHLNLPHTNGNFYLNGATTGTKTTPGAFAAGSADVKLDSNPQNLLASQWLLGRVAMLLVEPTGGVINDNSSPAKPQVYFQRGTGYTPLSSATTSSSGSKRLINARYDLAGTSISDYRAILSPIVSSAPTTWHQNFVTDRFEVDPSVSRPIDAAAASQQVPAFVPACTQFIVEFAGDFVTQDWDPDGNGTPDESADRADASYGQVLGVGSDGRVDTVYNPTLPVGERHTGQIRWYGLPRDTNGDGALRANDGDVVPVRDIAGAASAFERMFPSGAAIPTSNNYYTTTASSISPTPEYTVAWGPDDTNRPKFVRITLAIDRPEAEGRLLDGQTFEYVFTVGQ